MQFLANENVPLASIGVVVGRIWKQQHPRDILSERHTLGRTADETLLS